MKNVLKDIETRYPVDQVVANGEQVWPYLRIAYFFEYRKRVALSEDEKPPNLNGPLPQMLKRTKNIFYGLDNWFGKYEYLAFGVTQNRRLVGEEYCDRLLDPIIDELGKDRALYIEFPPQSLYPINKVHTRNIVCYDFIELCARLLSRFTPNNYKIENGSILDRIKKEYSLQINDAKLVKLFDSRRRIHNLILRRIKPKALLLTCYYGWLQPAIKAAKSLGIKVIEAQHGVIGKEHFAYNVYANLDRSFFPDYLLTFGESELKTFDNSHFIDQCNVYPVGSFYLEYMRTHRKSDSSIVNKLAGYRKVVGVTLQWTLENRTVDFVCEAANLDRTICYILIPREIREEQYLSWKLPDNVIVIKDKNFYELMSYVDFHSTVYSTCALEAPSLGVQNILINIDGLSLQYYGDILNDERITSYANTAEELVNAVNSFNKFERDTIAELNKFIIRTNYIENVRSFVQTNII
jgi:hypothetical protein